ncbi:MAG: DUF2283 domain-containing protein [Spirochaetia bacterium]|jgi:uncharacterized protein YuzE
MEKLKIYYDRTGNTLTVWFGDSKGEYTSEETDDEIVLMKNKDGQVIGFEKLNYSGKAAEHLSFSLETAEI